MKPSLLILASIILVVNILPGVSIAAKSYSVGVSAEVEESVSYSWVKGNLRALNNVGRASKVSSLYLNGNEYRVIYTEI